MSEASRDGREVRRLGEGDAAEYRAIRLAALKGAPEAFGSTFEAEKDRPLAVIAERLASAQVFGAYESDRIVGMIGLRREAGPKMDHKAVIWGFYVAPEARRGGHGKALVEAALAAARDIVEQVTLTVVVDNHAAIALYERFGFRRYGVEPRALRTPDGYVDEALMALVFPPRPV